MNQNFIKTALACALCLGLFSAGLIACDKDLQPQKKFPKKLNAVPEAFAEQRQLAEAADSLGSTGTVLLPAESEVTVHGEMHGGTAAFIKFLDERKTGLNYVYRKFQKLHPDLEGKITLDITVDVCGDVTSIAEIASTTGVPKFDIEVKKSLSRQKFPTTTQGHYTLSFALNFVKEAPVESAAAGNTAATMDSAATVDSTAIVDSAAPRDAAAADSAEAK